MLKTNNVCKCCREDRDKGLEGKGRAFAHKPDSLTSFSSTWWKERTDSQVPWQVLSRVHMPHLPCEINIWSSIWEITSSPFSSSQFRGRFLLSWVCVVCLCCSSNKNCPSLSATLTWVSYGTEFTLRNLSTLPGSTGRMASRLGKLPILGLGELCLDLNSPRKHSNQS